MFGTQTGVVRFDSSSDLFVRSSKESRAKIMRYFRLSVFVLVVIVSADVAALKCYTCVDLGDDACSKTKLEGNPAKYSTNCSSSLKYDRCLRMESSALGIKGVNTRCARQEDCTSEMSNCDQKKTGYENCKNVVCCSTDNCNAGSAFSFSVQLMAVCYAVGLVLVK